MTMKTNLAEILTKAIEEVTLIDKSEIGRPSVDDGYALQADILKRRGVEEPAGYKLSLRDGGKLYGAPLLFVSSEQTFRFETGNKVEVELAFVLGEDLPPRAAAYTRHEVVAAIDRVAIGIELVRSRYVDGAGDALGLLLADFMSNIGYVIGPSLDRSVLAPGGDLGELRLTNGASVLFDGPATHADGDPLAAVLICANRGLPTHGGGHLKKGQVVTTGTLCGAPVIAKPSAFTVSLGGGEVTITLD